MTGFYNMERRQYAEAEKLLKGAWPDLRERFGPRSYFGDQCLLHLSRLYEAQGNDRAAREYQALLRSRPAN